MTTATKLRLNFACGGSCWDGFDNSDTNGQPGTTFVDLSKPPYPYDANSAELILISHALFMGNHGVPMHPDLQPIMAEFHRILQPGGWLRIDDNPFRCFDPLESLDPGQAAEEAQRGYDQRWLLPREKLIALLHEVGFTRVEPSPVSSLAALAFPDAAAAIVSNQMGHYSFTIEAQK